MLESTRLSEQKAELSKKLRSERFAFMSGQEDDFAARQGEVRAIYDQIDALELRFVAQRTRKTPPWPSPWPSVSRAARTA